jgi:hypothetical protein
VVQLTRLTKSGKRQWISTSRLLTHSVITLGITLFLSYLASGFDTWLHISGESSFVEAGTPILGSVGSPFGRQINQTRCEYFAQNSSRDLGPNPDLLDLCGIFKTLPTDGVFGNDGPDTSASSAEAGLTLSNSSHSNLVVLTDDQHAIMVPPDLPLDVMFNATTVGVKSECRRFVLDVGLL